MTSEKMLNKVAKLQSNFAALKNKILNSKSYKILMRNFKIIYIAVGFMICKCIINFYNSKTINTLAKDESKAEIIFFSIILISTLIVVKTILNLLGILLGTKRSKQMIDKSK